MRFIRRFLFVILIFLCSITALAQTQNVLVSKGVNGKNYTPQIAVDTDTGNFIVVWWNQVGDSDVATVWVRIFIRKANGTYVWRKPERISAATGWNSFPHAVYVPWMKQYFIYWDQADFRAGLTTSNILGRKLNRNARPVGGVRKIVKDVRANYFPRVVVTQKMHSTAEWRKTIVLAWTANPVNKGDKQSGLRYAFMKPSMLPRGASKLIEKVSIAGNATRNSDGNFEYDALNKQILITDSLGYWSWVAFAWDVFPRVTTASPADEWIISVRAQARPITITGSKAKNSSLGDDLFFGAGEGYGGCTLTALPRDVGGIATTYGDTRTNLFIRGDYVAGYRGEQLADLDGYLLIGRGGNIDGAYLPRNYDNDTASQDQDLPLWRNGRPDPASGQRFAQWLYSDGTFVWSQGIDLNANNITEVNTPKKRFKHNDTLAWLKAEGVAGTSTVAVSWVKFITDNNCQVRLHIFN